MADIPELPQNVVSLVIAAREAFDTGVLPDDEQTALDKALEPFSAAVPYENEPDARAAEPAMDREAVEALEAIDRFITDFAGCDDSPDGMEVEQRAQKGAATVRRLLLSTLSADAIRQGEGVTTANYPIVPDGWKLVPIEPTPEMRQAAIDELSGPTDFSPKASAWDAIRAYRAMLAATPASHARDGGKA